MPNLEKKIVNHPRSQVARAYRLGQAQANGVLPLAKLTIRYLILKDIGMLRSKKQFRESSVIRARLLELTK